MKISKLFLSAFLSVIIFASYVNAAKPISAEDEALVKASNNPMADMMSLPFQFNYDYGSGPNDDGSKALLNIQPIIPVPVSDKFIMLTRTIIPINYADANSVGSDKFAMGDIVESIFFGPKSGKVIWGVGPAFMLPTATDDIFASEKWSAGPAAIIAYQEKGWTFAAISYQVWSFAGWGNNDVSFLFFQPVIMKSLGLISVGVNSEMQFDWENSTTIIPLNLMFSKLVKFGKIPVTLAAGLRYYLDKPDNYSQYGARFAITFMLPE